MGGAAIGSRSTAGVHVIGGRLFQPIGVLLKIEEGAQTRFVRGTFAFIFKFWKILPK